MQKFHRSGPEIKLFCKKCCFVTNSLSKLKCHQVCHSKLKPHQCQICNFRYCMMICHCNMYCRIIYRCICTAVCVPLYIDGNASKPDISKMHNVQETQKTVSKQTRNIVFAASIFAIFIDFAFKF